MGASVLNSLLCKRQLTDKRHRAEWMVSQCTWHRRHVPDVCCRPLPLNRRVQQPRWPAPADHQGAGPGPGGAQTRVAYLGTWQQRPDRLVASLPVMPPYPVSCNPDLTVMCHPALPSRRLSWTRAPPSPPCAASTTRCATCPPTAGVSTAAAFCSSSMAAMRPLSGHECGSFLMHSTGRQPA